METKTQMPSRLGARARNAVDYGPIDKDLPWVYVGPIPPEMRDVLKEFAQQKGRHLHVVLQLAIRDYILKNLTSEEAA